MAFSDLLLRGLSQARAAIPAVIFGAVSASCFSGDRFVNINLDITLSCLSFLTRYLQYILSSSQQVSRSKASWRDRACRGFSFRAWSAIKVQRKASQTIRRSGPHKTQRAVLHWRHCLEGYIHASSRPQADAKGWYTSELEQSI